MGLNLGYKKLSKKSLNTSNKEFRGWLLFVSHPLFYIVNVKERAIMKELIKGLLLIGLLTGCQSFNAQGDIKPMTLADNVIINQNLADEAKQIVLSMEEVVEVKGVNESKKIYLAPKVKHFDRLHLKDIRKRGHDAVKKRYPDASIHLSTDQKIFMELDKLEKKLKRKQISEKQLKEELKKLEEMMKGS